MDQKIIFGANGYKQIENILTELKSKKYLLVCGSSIASILAREFFNRIGIPYVLFSDFLPNPIYEDVCKGVQLFNKERCDVIVAIGGGSTIDVAKCIKLYCKMNPYEDFLDQEYFDSFIPLIVIPTTAGTGSESTRFAVIYYQGEKQSISDNSILPNYVILEPSFLSTLPIYQKKCTMLDALCQGIESWWSINSTVESIEYSRKAVVSIIANMDNYIFNGNQDTNLDILVAANYAGRAINIAQTTAPHAMSYKLSSLYGLPHGHAVAIFLPEVWSYMLDNINKCIDPRGVNYLSNTLNNISNSFGVGNVEEAIAAFRGILKKLEIFPPSLRNISEIDILARSVNIDRIKNNPIELDFNVLKQIYRKILCRGNI